MTPRINPLQTLKSSLNALGERFVVCRRPADDAHRFIILLKPLIVALFLSLASGSSGTLVFAAELAAERVGGWNFQRADDKNLDQYPDGWRRVRDRQHPAYIETQIVPRDSKVAAVAIDAQATIARYWEAIENRRMPSSYVTEIVPPNLSKVFDQVVLHNCLEVRMDGGAVEMVSPEFLLDPRFSYRMQLEMDCTGLDGHQAWAELQLIDEQFHVQEVLETTRISGTRNWQTLGTSSVSKTSKGLRWGRVHLKVEPRDLMLIGGTARFDSINIYRLPRLGLRSNVPHNIAHPGDRIDVACTAMGMEDAGAEVRFDLRDYAGNLLRSETLPLSPLQYDFAARGDDAKLKPAKSKSQSKSDPPSKSDPLYVSTKGNRPEPLAGAPSRKIFDGEASWNLQLDAPGLYRVSVHLGTGNSSDREQEIVIAVIPEAKLSDAGPFGWSIREFNSSVTPEVIPEMVAKFGAGWVKFPVWFEVDDTTTADRLVTLAERLQALGVECVGRLDEPPRGERIVFGNTDDRLYAVATFSDANVWQPVLEPVLTRMGMKIDWFQLGADDDLSFIGNPRVTEIIMDIRQRMASFSQELKLVFRWRWVDPPPSATVLPWNALHYSATPELAAGELLSYGLEPPQENVETWVTLNPLDGDRYTLLDRIRDLTERMINVKRANIPAAFLVDPFDPEHGLFDQNQNTGELLIPWRSLVDAIGGGQYIGSIRMPGQSVNHIFQQGSSATMILWRDEPGEEQLFLGNAIEATDIWGSSHPIKSVKSPRGFPEQQFAVSEWPVIIRNLDANVVQWRQSTQLTLTNLESTLGATQNIPVRLKNTLPSATAGSVTLASDSLINGGIASRKLQLGLRQQDTIEVPTVVRSDASAGDHDVRIDFELTTTQLYQFSVYRDITLGLGDVEFNWDSVRVDDNLVELRVELINNTTQPVNFDCKCFPAGLPYQRFQMLSAMPGSTVREFRLRLPVDSNSDQIWVRCEQIGSGRILNYRLDY